MEVAGSKPASLLLIFLERRKGMNDKKQVIKGIAISLVGLIATLASNYVSQYQTEKLIDEKLEAKFKEQAKNEN